MASIIGRFQTRIAGSRGGNGYRTELAPLTMANSHVRACSLKEISAPRMRNTRLDTIDASPWFRRLLACGCFLNIHHELQRVDSIARTEARGEMRVICEMLRYQRCSEARSRVKCVTRLSRGTLHLSARVTTMGSDENNSANGGALT